jgi:hypothetical protein
MLHLLKIFIISLLLIIGSHYIYEQVAENVIKNNKCNKNRFEYHTFKYREILNEIIKASNLSSQNTTN